MNGALRQIYVRVLVYNEIVGVRCQDYEECIYDVCIGGEDGGHMYCQVIGGTW